MVENCGRNKSIVVCLSLWYQNHNNFSVSYAIITTLLSNGVRYSTTANISSSYSRFMKSDLVFLRPHHQMWVT